MPRLSPLMDQYYKIKDQYKDAILLFRIGDFYETFGEDAVTVARDLNITLTSRQKDYEGNKIPLAGVPYHALDTYLARLVKSGHKVAICDQVEDPKLAKGLVKREITRVVTPGTVIEPSMLEESSNNFLAAVLQEDERAGVAFVDISTGEFLTSEVPSKRIGYEIAKFRPSECIASSEQPLECSRVQALNKESISSEKACMMLEDKFGSGWMERFRLTGKDLCIKACGAVLEYLHKSHFDTLGHLNEIRFYSGSDFMVLDEVTLRNLEILRNIRDRSKRGTLLEFLSKTKTPMGARTLVRWVQMPLLSLDKIERRLDAVEELSKDAILRSTLLEELKGTADIERLIGRVSCGAATPKDLVILKSSLQKLPAILTALGSAGSKDLEDLRSRLNPLEEIVALIEKSITDDPPANLRDGSAIRDGFHEELDSIRSLLRDGKGWISRLENTEKKRTGIKSLKVGYTGVFGYYIEVSRPNLHLVPDNYMRKQTLANCERFITPELKEMEAKVISAQERSSALEHEIFDRVTSQIADYAKEIQLRATALSELDVLCAFAGVASDYSFVRPEFNTDGRISLRASKHPVLDESLHGGFVPNDVSLDSDKSRLIILTGPNMAGKSTFMRQIAIVVILAQVGSFVPATFASLSLIDRIFTRVGAYDDLSAGQSTFMVEMTELSNILSAATKDSLILLDEVGRGTSTFDGLSLAWAISEYIHNTIKAKAVFATHYHQLTQLEETLSGVKNYSMAVKEDRGSITFIRTVVPGATDKSYGVHVARLAGMPEAVTKRADEILREIERDAVIDPLAGSKKGKRSGKSKYTQLIFFDQSGGESGLQEKKIERDPVVEEIAGLDLDSMTPREAHSKLAKYQKVLRERECEG
ncbi:MAG: DNA mismatch repair protein MutS [Methanotrichaceae archaeon]